MAKDTIHIITTGGTIAGLEHDLTDNGPSVSIAHFLESANVSFEYALESPFEKDSRFITEEDRAIIAAKITSSSSARILVTHGTLTMLETAQYLAERKFNRTIVLVGAFILGTQKNTDAPFNLGYALGAIDFLDNGVYIAMNGLVLPWDKITKNRGKNRFEKKI